jgi:hypothetical protein
MKANREKKTDNPDSEWLIESPVGPDTARTRGILNTIPDVVVPGWKAKPEEKDDVCDRALLIAQGRPRDKNQTAERLLREAEFEVGEKRLEAMAAEADALPQLAAEALEVRKKHKDETTIEYGELISLVTGRKRWDRALPQWKDFWAKKAKREGQSETWLEAKLLTYRNPKKKITLAEAEGLREEFSQLSGYRGQGNVLRPADGRLKVNKNKKLARLQKAQELKKPRGRPRTKPPLVFTDNIEKTQAIQAAGGKTLTPAPAY